MALFKRSRSDSHHDHKSDVVSAGDAIARVRIKVEGTVLRMKTKPAVGLPTLVVTIGDDNGRVQAQWSGRRSIPGIALGAHVIIEGVATPTPDGLMYLNPLYEVLPAH